MKDSEGNLVVHPDDHTPKERALARYLIHLATAHEMTDLTGDLSCRQCDHFKVAIND